MSTKSRISFLFFAIGLAVFLAGSVAASPKNKSIGYIFNANGRLLRIEGVKNNYPLLKKKRTIYFKIEDNDRTLRNRIQPVLNKYLDAFTHLKKQENQEVLTRYFDFKPAEIKTLMQEYLSTAVFLNGKFKFEKSLVNSRVDEADSIQYYDNAVAENFRKETYEKFFTIEILVSNNVEPIILNFSDSTMLTPAQVQEILRSTRNNIPDGFRYELRFTPIESRYVQNNQKAIQENIPDAKEFKAVLDVFNEAVKITKEIHANLREEKCENIKETQNLLDQLDKTQCEQIRTYLKKNKEWIKLFLWYTGGVPSFIPFETESSMISYKDTIVNRNKKISGNDTIIAHAKVELNGLTEKKSAIASVLSANHAGCDTCLGSIPDTLLRLEEKLGQIRLRIQMIIDTNLDLAKQNKENARADSIVKDRRKKLQQKDVFLYAGKVVVNSGPICRPSGNTFIREHDAENGCLPMMSFMDNYDETSHVMIMIENTTKKAEFTQFIKPVTDVSVVESEALPALGKILDFITNVKGLINKSGDGAPCEDQIDANTQERVTRDMGFFNKILKYSPWFDYFQLPASTPLKHTQDTTGKNLPNFVSSYKVCYQIKQGNRIDSFEYRKNKRYLFWPTAGFLYSFAKDPQVTINSDGTLSTKYYSGMYLMAGLTIHPWRTAVMDPYFVISSKRRPYFDYRKIFLVLGVDALNMPNIYYIGAGIDLWSGLSLTAGSQLIVKKQWKYVNGTATSKDYLDWKNLYIGINIDLSLALKMLQFFAFKK
ncbi:MAG: hypothetical protein NTU98_14395 [Bacteroidetes bacterium]|nr:hypothetical protein [Bacteroidota bacterium]